jgi:hypothetical protein
VVRLVDDDQRRARESVEPLGERGDGRDLHRAPRRRAAVLRHHNPVVDADAVKAL